MDLKRKRQWWKLPGTIWIMVLIAFILVWISSGVYYNKINLYDTTFLVGAITFIYTILTYLILISNYESSYISRFPSVKFDLEYKKNKFLFTVQNMGNYEAKNINVKYLKSKYNNRNISKNELINKLSDERPPAFSFYLNPLHPKQSISVDYFNNLILTLLELKRNSEKHLDLLFSIQYENSEMNYFKVDRVLFSIRIKNSKIKVFNNNSFGSMFGKHYEENIYLNQ